MTHGTDKGGHNQGGQDRNYSEDLPHAPFAPSSLNIPHLRIHNLCLKGTAMFRLLLGHRNNALSESRVDPIILGKGFWIGKWTTRRSDRLYLHDGVVRHTRKH